MKEPTKKEWSDLYAAAVAFCREEPWEALDDEEPIAIQNPEDGGFGYGVVLGAAGMEFGFALYLGADGYESYRSLSDAKFEPESIDALTAQHAVSLIMADREHLDSEDRKLIKSLGLRFRGRGAWPMFRSLRPGCCPWFIDGPEARFLTLALNLMLEIVPRIDVGDLEPFDEDNPESLLTLVRDDGKWVERWRRPERPLEVIEPAPDISEREDVRRLTASTNVGTGAWEMGLSRLSSSVAPEDAADRPYFPKSLMATEPGRGTVAGFEVLPTPHPSPEKQQDAFVDMLREAGERPAKIQTEDKGLAEVLAPVAQAMGIRVDVGPTPFLKEARDMLDAWMEEEMEAMAEGG